MISSLFNLKHRVLLMLLSVVSAVPVSAQTFMVFSAEKTLSLYVGTSMNLGHQFTAKDNYDFEKSVVKPGLALNFSYAWSKELGDWLYGSYNLTLGLQQDRFSATFRNRSTNAQETYDASLMLFGVAAAYRLGFDIGDRWQAYVGLGTFIRIPVKSEPPSSGIGLGLFPEVNVYYHINKSLCCSFLARYDVLASRGILFSDYICKLANGAYVSTNGKALTCMVGIGYCY